MHCGIGDVVVDHAKRGLHHIAAVVDLGHDPVGAMRLVRRHRDLGHSIGV
jgi:hypothetical protein